MENSQNRYYHRIFQLLNLLLLEEIILDKGKIILDKGRIIPDNEELVLDKEREISILKNRRFFPNHHL